MKITTQLSLFVKWFFEISIYRDFEMSNKENYARV